MSTFRCTAPRPAVTAACALALGLLCSEAQAKCDWQTGATYMSFNLDVGTRWVPRDAPIGSEIASIPLNVPNDSRAALNCFYEASPPTTFSMPASTAMALGVPVQGQRFADRVLLTNIDGIGAIVTVGPPFTGAAYNSFTPDDNKLTIPYKGTMRTDTGFAARVANFRGTLQLIKTGPIPAGEYDLNRELFHGLTNDKGKVMDFSVRGKIRQAQCKLLGNPVSADPVRFADHTLADFTGPGPVGTEVAFNIRLSDCDDDSTAPTAFAHIELDGTNGSSVVDADQGVFSLGTGSTADGFGVQIMHGDGRPLPLQKAVGVKRLNVGETLLDFKARYFQLEPKEKVKAGLAKASLKFTISYK